MEDRDRFLQEQREKLHVPIQQSDYNGEQQRRQKRSRRLADKENLETIKKPSLRSKRNTANDNETSDDEDDYSPQPLAQFVRKNRILFKTNFVVA